MLLGIVDVRDSLKKKKEQLIEPLNKDKVKQPMCNAFFLLYSAAFAQPARSKKVLCV